MICPIAKKAVLKFCKDHKPKHRIHLGDFTDTGAWRAGHSDMDAEDPIEPDIEEGLQFTLDEFHATDVLAGNHEDRLWRKQHSKNEIVSYCARTIIRRIHERMRKADAKFHAYDGVFQGFERGGVKWMHGVMYSENATRDHAEAMGMNVVHAHTHRPGLAFGRMIGQPIGIGTGTLTRLRAMEYAKCRRSTLAWGQAFVYGEICKDQASLHLCLGPTESQPDKEWRLP